MNTGTIATRYARALLRYVSETGNGERVCTQVRALLADPGHAPSPLEPELQRFVALLVERGRMEYVRFIFASFVRMYYRAAGIKYARLTTVVPAPELEEKIRKMVESKTGCRLEMETATDPSLIGGFIFEVDDKTLDASVRNQIATIRREFVDKNRRIV